jgi:NAD(P)-dependent dehydrogenase (short-subunit alcohol dehydrogenase family)
MNTLQGKVAVVTGGSRGLGLAISQAYAREGAAVMIGARTPTSIELATAAIRAQGGLADGFLCNVVELDQVQALAQQTINQFGQLDIWVNNAGIGAPMGPTIHIPPMYLKQVIDTNITGTYNGSWTAMQHFLRMGAGKLINMSGRGEKRPTPMLNPYGASKSWVYSFTMSLAKEYRDSGVGIYLFQPGLVKSEMMGHMYFIDGFEDQLLKVFRVVARLFALPLEIPANKAVWLASSATDGKTGLHVNLLGPRMILKGVVKELFRIISRQPTLPLDSKISLVAPAIDVSRESSDSRLQTIQSDEETGS